MLSVPLPRCNDLVTRDAEQAPPRLYAAYGRRRLGAPQIARSGAAAVAAAEAAAECG